MAKRSKSYYQHLPNSPGKKIRGHGTVRKIRTKRVKPGVVIHCRVMSKKGPRKGKTVCGGPIHTKKK